MMQLRCTKKVRDQFKLKANGLHEINKTSMPQNNWLVNLIKIERRKALLFMHEQSFLSFVLYGITQANTKDLGQAFSKGLNDLLVYENFSKDQIAKILAEINPIEYTKTQSRSHLGNLNDLTHQYKIYIEHNGGSDSCNLNEIAASINRTPQSNLGWAYSIDRFKTLIENSKV